MRGFCPLLVAGSLSIAVYAIDVEELRSVGALPAHIAGSFTEIGACHTTPAGEYLIFDRRAHAVATASQTADAPRVIVHIGIEAGKILQPSAFDSAPDGTFAIADAPGGHQRIQFFTDSGSPRGGFSLSRPPLPQFTIGDVVVSGVGSLKYTGLRIFVSQPETGALATEYDLAGGVVRTFGVLRTTGQERDRAVHVALNLGMVLPIPSGGCYFVFRSGVPMFRKYDDAGRLLFERHIEGTQIDDYVRALPTTWAPRRPSSDEFPLVFPTVRAAAVDADARLWISLAEPYTYVYDSQGDKRRIVQFRGAGLITPTGFFFTKTNQILVTPGCYGFSR